MRVQTTVNRIASRPGALATELALVLPFLVFALLVAVDFCRIYQVTQILNSSAHVAVLHASGSTQPPIYQPNSGGLLSGVTELVRPILGGQAVDSYGQLTPNWEAAARKAARAESASLRPPLGDDQISITYQNNNAQVTVTYTVELITPIFGSSRTVQLSRTTTMLVIGAP